jgi:hypothetical protein
MASSRIARVGGGWPAFSSKRRDRSGGLLTLKPLLVGWHVSPSQSCMCPYTWLNNGAVVSLLSSRAEEACTILGPTPPLAQHPEHPRARAWTAQYPSTSDNRLSHFETRGVIQDMRVTPHHVRRMRKPRERSASVLLLALHPQAGSPLA